MTPAKPSSGESVAAPSGLLVVDKPGGMTSHDVVGRVRRLLGTKKVGHAGTLDPMASGVLVVLVGEATKLGAYVTAHEKTYEARVAFGLATDTLDREGATTEEAEAPAWLRDELARVAEGRDVAREAPRLEASLQGERERASQVPPAYSAIQVGGVRSYARARAGLEVVLEERPVEVLALTVLRADPAPAHPWADVAIAVTKGYYVRSFARDLGARLGLPAHLAALRRTASGPFTLARATLIDAGAEALRAAIVPLAVAAAEALPEEHLTAAGVLRARRGQPLEDDCFASPPGLSDASAWLDPTGELVAIGARRADGFTIHRGFGPTPPRALSPEHEPPTPPDDSPRATPSELS